MLKVLFFIWKYKILKDEKNLSKQTKKFFELTRKEQKIILDKYFDKFTNKKGLDTYFDSKESRYFDNSIEITFFHCPYFDKKLIDYNINCISYIDKFIITEKEKDDLIGYVLKKENLNLTASDLINYKDDLPLGLSSNLDFMKYLVSKDESNIKYITYNEKNINSQRELIKDGINKARENNTPIRKFLKNDGELPKILEHNFDFLIFLIENNIENIDYIEESIIDNLTISNKRILIDTIITSLNKDPNNLKNIEKNLIIASILNQDEDFINDIIEIDINNIKYIDWHHLNDIKREKIINNITQILIQKNISINIMKMPFHDLFFQNEQFMSYLIQKDFRWIAIIKVNTSESANRLIDQFFNIIKDKKYHFQLEDFLEDGKHLNERLVENTKMLHYLLIHKVAVCHYIDFFHLNSSKIFIENLLKEMESKYFEFSNDDFLVNGKYPIPLSNSERFMRYVIDKNFNNLAYIDTSMIDKRELKKIINYACRMAYYIRGNNKNLTFDIDGYFKGKPILEDEYFKECLDSF